MKDDIFRKLIKVQHWLDSVDFLKQIALTPKTDLKNTKVFIGTNNEKWPYLRVCNNDETLFTIQSKASLLGGTSYWLMHNIGGIVIGITKENTIRLSAFNFAFDSIAQLNIASRNGTISIGYSEGSGAAHILYCTPIPGHSLLCKKAFTRYFNAVKEEINSHLVAVQAHLSEEYYSGNTWHSNYPGSPVLFSEDDDDFELDEEDDEPPLPT
jgi:hypothetical protein